MNSSLIIVFCDDLSSTPNLSNQVMQIVYVLHWICIDEFNTEEEAYENGKTKLESLVARLQSFDM